MSHKVLMYKYKPLPTAQDLQYLEQSLTQHAIWMPPLKSLNDPFEAIFRLIPASAEDLRNNDKLRQFVLDWHHQHGAPGLTEEQLFDAAILADQNPLKAYIKSLFREHGVFSLTACPSNIPMWNHYANAHKGYVVIFEVDLSVPVSSIINAERRSTHIESIIHGEKIVAWHESDNDSTLEFMLGKVEYGDKPPEFSFNKLNNIQNKHEAKKYVFKHCVSFKYEQWAYEEEFRIVANQNSDISDKRLMHLPYYVPFIKIKGLIMGKGLAIKNVFTDLCKRTSVDLYQANCSDEDYRITFKKILDQGHDISKHRSICKCQCLPELMS